uniref:Uncharacterized protein n=1 Tax=Panagrolaimus sp. PS1159 TaxID=55785 RepID=A0AC35FRG5_9BILA
MSSFPLSCNMAHVKNIKSHVERSLFHEVPLSKSDILESVSTKPSTKFSSPLNHFQQNFCNINPNTVFRIVKMR